MHFLCLYVFIFINPLLGDYIGLEFEDTEMSFNTLRFNSTMVFGFTSSKYDVTGMAVLIHSASEVESIIMDQSTDNLVLVLHDSIFTDKGSMVQILECQKVVGIVVQSSPHDNDSEVMFFSEFPNELNMKVLSNDKADLYSQGYYYYSWKIPVVLLRNYGYQDRIQSCIRLFSKKSIPTRGCTIQITNYIPDKLNYNFCKDTEKSWKRIFWLTKNNDYCKYYYGYNIYVTFNEVKFYLKDSIILICTRTDTISMFDTAAIGALQLYPSISSMIYMAKIFEEASKEGYIDNHSDILMAFLDNFDAQMLGPIKLAYDLKMNRISNTKINISNKNIKLVIFVDELFADDRSLTVVTTHCKRTTICQRFLKNIAVIAKEYSLQLKQANNFYIASSFMVDLFDVPYIEIKSNIVTRNLFKYSYLDRNMLNSMTYLKDISRTVSLSILQLLATREGTFEPKFNEFTPKDIALCLQNISCTLFSGIIGSGEQWLYNTYANPFIAQTFVNEIIEAKDGKYIHKLSAFVLKLMVVYLGRKLESIENCHDFQNLRYFSTTINDELVCFDTKIQLETGYRTHESVDPKAKQLRLNSMMMASIYRNRKVLLYVSQDSKIFNTLVVIYTISCVICILGSVLMNHQTDMFETDEDEN